MGAGELGVGHIQADAHTGFRAELLDEVGIDKEVVITLPTEVPGEGHRLGNDLLAGRIDLLKLLIRRCRSGCSWLCLRWWCSENPPTFVTSRTGSVQSKRRRRSQEMSTTRWSSSIEWRR